MSSSKLHNLAKLDELERIKVLLDQTSSTQRTFDISEVSSQLYNDIESVFLIIKFQFNVIKHNLDPEAFMICLNFFDWFLDEFKRFKVFLSRKCSQKNEEYIVQTTRSLVLQLTRFIGFLEKTTLVYRI